jgi:hypothetical protein
MISLGMMWNQSEPFDTTYFDLFFPELSVALFCHFMPFVSFVVAHFMQNFMPALSTLHLHRFKS